MKLGKEPIIEVKEQKINSYTDSKKYIVVINGQKYLSGDTIEDALMISLKFMHRYEQMYKADLEKIKKSINPIISYYLEENEE